MNTTVTATLLRRAMRALLEVAARLSARPSRLTTMVNHARLRGRCMMQSPRLAARGEGARHSLVVVAANEP
jgi:hypothetical protein